MSGFHIRRLLDIASDIACVLSIKDLRELAKLHQDRPLEIAFLVRIGQRLKAPLPKRTPKYVRCFLQECFQELNRYEPLCESRATISAVEHRRWINQLVYLAGLTTRERRYVCQLYGYEGFSQLDPSELAVQDCVTRAYISKVSASSIRRLQAAVALSQMPADERKRLLVRT